MNGHIVILHGSHFTWQQAQLVISLAALSCAGLNLPTTGVLGDRWGPRWCHIVKLIIISCNFHRSKIISVLGCSWKWFIMQMTWEKSKKWKMTAWHQVWKKVVWRPLIDSNCSSRIYTSMQHVWPKNSWKNLFSCKAAGYSLPLEYSLLFKVFYLVPCGYRKLWEDTVAYKYSHGAFAEDKTISHKESPQKYSTPGDFCLSKSSLLLASVCVQEILTTVCGEKQSIDGWMCELVAFNRPLVYRRSFFLDKSSVISQNMEVH